MLAMNALDRIALQNENRFSAGGRQMKTWNTGSRLTLFQTRFFEPLLLLAGGSIDTSRQRSQSSYTKEELWSDTCTHEPGNISYHCSHFCMNTAQILSYPHMCMFTSQTESTRSLSTYMRPNQARRKERAAAEKLEHCDRTHVQESTQAVCVHDSLHCSSSRMFSR